ncbi:tetratricopeptide repeat protein [Pseudoduganella plicata]|uniref:Sel1 repeat family protein n=1 Tax=Pseudoduganella plicata TaxID=321984 RepID=A0A4P7BEE0_9BURK|nr:tetratricopeptide repeat protein [Pseudoduganella plicata]QBQ36337.1 sel1 repeat family protein [Pseudoduganella plicata]GGY75994.1 hypothetical protein GCM10007388_05730 [Pseudoduganella plicata]
MTVRCACAIVLAAALAGCGHEAVPTSAQIEALAMTAAQRGDPAAEQRLQRLAVQGATVAQRELGILYRARPAARADAQRLLLQAAQAGDAQAAFHLGELYRVPAAGIAADPAAAWPWYQRAAEGGQAKAALQLGLMAKNGNGVPRDAAVAARWLQLAAELGNAHAMFLLSYAYREGEGVTRDPARAAVLLEEAAEHEYPPALQELALTTQDPTRAGHLMKEATEHRRNNWNRF